MKKFRKKLTAVLLVCALCAMAYIPASALPSINGTPVSGDAQAVDGSWTYNLAQKKLTLNNCSIEASGYAIVDSEGDLEEIELIGENTITGNSYGISVTEGDLKITGSGSLSINSRFSTIYLGEGNLTVDGATLTLASSSQATVIVTNYLKLENGAKVTATASNISPAVLIDPVDSGLVEGIIVSGGSTFEAYSTPFAWEPAPFNGSLAVSDTSKVTIRSTDSCDPFEGNAEKVTLVPVPFKDFDEYYHGEHGYEWDVVPDTSGERYAFSVTKTEIPSRDGTLYQIEITGTERDLTDTDPDTDPDTGTDTDTDTDPDDDADPDANSGGSGPSESVPPTGDSAEGVLLLFAAVLLCAVLLGRKAVRK